jgi:hypothetical protein
MEEDLQDAAFTVMEEAHQVMNPEMMEEARWGTSHTKREESRHDMIPTGTEGARCYQTKMAESHENMIRTGSEDRRPRREYENEINMDTQERGNVCLTR